VPGIHVVLSMLDDVDGRDKPGHDDAEGDGRKTSIAICDSPGNDGERVLLHQLGGEQGKRVTAFSAVIPGRRRASPESILPHAP
uniref:hypothetical protein n=1 Tax=Bradyrhizobium sp. SZCCHNS2017 TaxID=3057306 RepID=UPI002915D513